MRNATWVCVLAVLGAGSCHSATHDAHSEGKLVHVLVSVYAWNDARVGALLIDGARERTGWYRGRPIREIRGCMHEYGSDEGVPEGSDEDDTTSAPLEAAAAPEDTTSEAMSRTPKYHHFTVQDSAGAPSVIRQGGCELRLDPEVGGKVHLILIADGIGIRECKDTTSVWVKPGAPSRWWLRWKASGDSCAVKISGMRATTTNEAAPRRGRK